MKVKKRAAYLSELLFLLNEQGKFEDVVTSFNRWNRLPKGAKPPPSSDEALRFATPQVRTLGHGIVESLHEGKSIDEIEDKTYSIGRTASLTEDEAEVWNRVGLALTYSKSSRIRSRFTLL